MEKVKVRYIKVGYCSVNKAELLPLNNGLHEASRLNPNHLIVEDDSTCVIWWASFSSNPPWYLADLIDEVLEVVSSYLNVSLQSHKAHNQ